MPAAGTELRTEAADLFLGVALDVAQPDTA